MNLQNLQDILDKYEKLQEKLSDVGSIDPREFGKIAKESSDMTPVVEKIRSYMSYIKNLEETEELLSLDDTEPELAEIAKEEIALYKKSIEEIQQEIKLMLLPKDEDDDKNVIMEIRSGAGGDEAELFVSDLLEMYKRFSDKEGWKFDILSLSSNDIGGIKEVSMDISGKNVFSRLKFESGVHRVQRIPVTESSGRIHTSTVTVAVLPAPEEVDIKISEKDLRIDVYRASGPGGQSVNTTDSAVRITHIPTGIVVSQQDEKSQHKNKAKAMKVLMSRLYEKEKEASTNARGEIRKQQVGTGDRSERIRTYNFPQSRVTDHRIGMSIHNIELIIKEGNLGDLISALISENQALLMSKLDKDE